MALPDLRGRAFFGMDDMGNSAASRLGSVVTGTTNGASGGAETVTLSTTQIPSHTHDLSNHTHTVAGDTLAQSADHTHTYSGTTSTTGAHSHTTTVPNAAGAGGTQTWSISAAGANYAATSSTEGSHDHTFSGTTSGVSANHVHAFSVTSGTPSDNTSGAAGSSGSHSNMPPAFVTTYIIKL
jgi:microcystin-dependent protein